MDLTSYLHMIWSAPIQIALSLYFLWAEMSYAVFGGVAVMILMIPLNGFIAKKTRAQQVLQMKQKDQRIKMMNEVRCLLLCMTFIGAQWRQSHQTVCLGRTVSGSRWQGL